MSDDLQSLVDDLTEIGLNVQIIGFSESPFPPQSDLDHFTIRDFLEYCIRLTGERFLVNPSIAAHFLSLRIPRNLYDISEFPDHGTAHRSFNSVPRETDVDRP